MRHALKYILPAIWVILASGCARKDGTNMTEQNIISEKQIISPSRFGGPASATARFETNNQPELLKDAEPEYYIPDYRAVENRTVIPIRNTSIPILSIFHSDNLAEAGIENYRKSSGQEYENDYVHDYLFFSISFDNDIFDNTDYYYTNGLSFEVVHPLLQLSPLSQALLPLSRKSINYYGIRLVQNIYTPIDPENNNIQYGDRPFASYLYISHEKISTEPERGIKLTSSLDLGIIGPDAFGGVVQGTIHEKDPVGWAYQISNDVVINYNAEFKKRLLYGRMIEAGTSAAAQAGTLYDNLQCGLFLILGKTNGYFNSHNLTTPGEDLFRKRIRYYFSFDLAGKYVVYDATLQGGIFNKKSIYTLEPEEISRFVVNGTVGIGIGLGKVSLEAQQVYVSPEFKSGRQHLWGRIKLGVNLD